MLEDLAGRLDNTANVSALTQAIHGLGGVGKTQVAIEYCYRYADRYREIFWADASSPEGLTARYADLARQSGRVGPAVPVDEAAASFLAGLSAQSSWLLVLDNVEERAAELPRPADREGHVLITSQLRTLPPGLGVHRPIEVEVLPLEEAVAFLLERIGRPDPGAEEQAAAHALAEDLGGLPLALEQAAAYIVDLQVAFGVYLERIRARREVLVLEEDSWKIMGGYEKDVASTWLLNMEQLPPAARAVMNACTFLAPDRIPLSLFVQQADRLGPELCALSQELRTDPLAAHRQLVRPLTRFSLFRFDPERQQLEVHRMVQWVARQRLETRGESIGVFHRVHSAVEAAFPLEQSSPATWGECALLFPHVVALKDYMRSTGGRDGFDPTPLWAKAWQFVWAAGRSSDALSLSQDLVEVRRRMLGDEHPDTLGAMSNVAAMRLILGDGKLAQRLLEPIVEASRRVLGEEHTETLKMLHNLAEARRTMGDAAGARQVFERIVEASRRVLGDEHPDTLESLNGLAATQLALGEAELAQRLFEQIVESRRRVLGAEHPDTLTSLNNLAYIRRALGDAAAACQLYETVAGVSRRVLGEEHPDTLTSLNNLAFARRVLGDAAGARQLLERVVEVSRRVLGDEHPITLNSLNLLAETRRTLGDVSGARQLHESVVEVRRRVLGDEHPDTLSSLNNLALTLNALGDAEGARHLHEQVVEVRRRLLGDEHPHTLSSLNNLAVACDALGDAEGACHLHEQVVEVRCRLLGEEHPDTLNSLNNLAATSRALGDAEGSRQLHEKVVEVRRRVLGEEHPETLRSRHHLALARWALDDASGARELLKEVVEASRRVLGEEHPDTAKARSNLDEMRRPPKDAVPDDVE